MKKLTIVAMILLAGTFAFAKQYLFEGKSLNAEKAKNNKVRELIDEGYAIVETEVKGMNYTILYEDTIKTSVKKVTESEEFKKAASTAKDIGGKLWEGAKKAGREIAKELEEAEASNE